MSLGRILSPGASPIDPVIRHEHECDRRWRTRSIVFANLRLTLPIAVSLRYLPPKLTRSNLNANLTLMSGKQVILFLSSLTLQT